MVLKKLKDKLTTKYYSFKKKSRLPVGTRHAVKLDQLKREKEVLQAKRMLREEKNKLRKAKGGSFLQRLSKGAQRIGSDARRETRAQFGGAQPRRSKRRSVRTERLRDFGQPRRSANSGLDLLGTQKSNNLLGGSGKKNLLEGSGKKNLLEGSGKKNLLETKKKGGFDLF